MGIQKSTPSPVEILADDTGEEANQRAKLPDKLQRYGNAKSKALAIADYIRSEVPHYPKYPSLISDCGSYLVFRDYYTVDQVKLHAASFCRKHLLCPLCAIRRGSKHLSRYIERFTELTASEPLLRPYLVTLTVKDGPDLKERFDHLKKSLVSFHKRRHGQRNTNEAKKATAAVWSYEIKRGKNSGQWHPHVHAIWLCASPPDQFAISEQWRKITRDSFIVDVRPISNDDPVSGFLEVFKYAIKFSDQPESDTWHCFEILKGKRLIGSFGDFYGIPEPDELTDDPIEGLPYHEHFYQFLSGKYQLKN